MAVHDSQLYLGLISGTSADGIDVALASFDPLPRLHAAQTVAYSDSLRARLLAVALGDGRITLDELGALDIETARAFATAASTLLAREGLAAEAIRAIGSHGQTVRHRPDAATRYTLQLGDPNVIAELTGIATVADFRRRDLAAGGQGAPLAPAFHAAMLATDVRTRVVLNLGGIANISVLRAGAAAPLLGFDTGPASCLLDSWAQRELGRPYDVDGAFAASGRVHEVLLQRLLADPYFAASAPKSTGREWFNAAWLEPQLRGIQIGAADVQATLLALTVRSVGAAIRAQASDAQEVLVCGGGVHNSTLMQHLATELAPLPVISTAVRGIDPDFVEAMLFAWLARERLAGRPPARLHEATGARAARVLGGVYFGV